MTGPNTGARNIGTPTMLITRPIRSRPAACARIVCPTGINSPPPRPCTTRKAISDPIDHASPASSDPAMNTMSAVTQTRRAPNRPLSHAVSGMTLANASRYAVITHWMEEIDVSSSRPSVGIATFTIVASRIAITDPATTTPPRVRISRSTPAIVPCAVSSDCRHGAHVVEGIRILELTLNIM